MRQYVDGDYQVTEYDNGATIREMICDPCIPEPIEPIEPIISPAQQCELDRDEMLIDLILQQQEILLELQMQAAN